MFLFPTLLVVSQWRRAACLVAATALVFLSAVAAGTQPAQAPPNRTQGLLFSGAVNLARQDVRISAALFIPRSTMRIRSVVAVLHHGLMSEQLFFGEEFRAMVADASGAAALIAIGPMSGPQPGRTVDAEPIRNAATGSGEGVVRLMDQFAAESGHDELRSTPLLFWGFSAGASFGTTFAGLQPERTIGFVRYHTNRRGVPATLDALTEVPGLLIAGANDEVAGVGDAEAMWKAGGAAEAPWTFAVEPEAKHSSPDIHEVTAHELTIPWMAAVLQERLSADGRLQSVAVTRSWLGDVATQQIAPAESFAGDRRNATWLPDTRSAEGWRVVVRGSK